MLALKAGVTVGGLSPEILLAIMVAHAVYQEFGQGLTVTSVRDGVHKTGSKHYQGDGADLRTRVFDSEATKRAVRDVLASRLGHDYDVVLEPTHIHVEYDPKTEQIHS